MPTPLNLEGRLRHSELSSEEFIKFCTENSDAIDKKLSERQINIISDIIIAHSDIKSIDNTGKITKKTITISETSLAKKKVGEINSDIPVRFLAGLLRIADEFDITKYRLGGKEKQLNFLSQENSEHAESIEHWKKLMCFSDVDFSSNIIELVVDDSQYSKERIETGKASVNVLNKIRSEFQLVRELCFNESPYLTAFAGVNILNKDVLTVEPSNSVNLTVEADEQKDKISAEHNMAQANDEPPKGDMGSFYAPYLFDIIESDTTNKIDSFVYKYTLYRDSHFILTDSICARDWIDTTSIIEDRKLKVAICDDFVRHLRARWDENRLKKMVMVGIGVRGTAIASTMAFEMMMPFSYIIPNNSHEHNSMQDKKFLTDEYISDGYEEFILVTDVMVSADTVKNALTHNKLAGRVPIICSVLCRPITNYNDFADKINDSQNLLANTKIYALSNNFPIWIFNKADCPVYALSVRSGAEFQCLDCNKISS